MKTTFITLISIILIGFSAYSQNNKEFELENFKSKADYEKAIKLLYTADDYYDDGIDAYDKALEYFLKASELNPDNAELNFKMGICYYYTNNNFESLNYYNKAIQLDSNVSEIILYRIAQGHQFRLQFDEAIVYYSDFISNYTQKDREIWIKETDKRIEECDEGKKIIENFMGGLVVNIANVNSKYIDHSPLITPDESTLFFTSRRPNNTNDDVDKNGRLYEDIYFAKKNADGIWQPAENIGSPLNTKNHDATIGVSADGTKLYLYEGKKGNILVSEQNSEGWSKPKALPAPINSKYQETAISFSPDGKKAYFVSNRPNGIGKKDIWVADVAEGDVFSKPRVLSSVINTKYNERTVFIHPDGKTMYFSSEGHHNMGGFDVFKSTLDANGEWGTPENIGYPINTTGDDVGFVTSADNKRGYFSSLKLNSKGGQDIYMYVFPEVSTEGQVIVIRGEVKDLDNHGPIKAKVSFTDVKTGKKIEILSDPKTGEFIASVPKGKDYAVNVTSDGYLIHSETINSSQQENLYFTLSMDMPKVEESKSVVLKNIWFDFDSSVIKAESHAELNAVVDYLKNNADYKAEVAGYTCNAGDKTFNYQLSKRRAASVVKFLSGKGIAKERLISKGYGPENPAADNASRKGRKQNRRVEFKILK